MGCFCTNHDKIAMHRKHYKHLLAHYKLNGCELSKIVDNNEPENITLII